MNPFRQGVEPPFKLRWRSSTRARRLSLKVDGARQEVLITLPEGATQQTALVWLEKNKDWVHRALAKQIPATPLGDGSTIPFEDVELTVRHAPDARRGTWREDKILYVSGEVEFLPRRVMAFMHQEAQTRLPTAVRRWAAIMKLAPGQIALRDVRSRWGSCSHQGRIMLNWRLLMMPIAMRDYVIVHELAHLVHLNHSPAFWQVVDRYYPDRAEAENWLKVHGSRILSIGRP